MVQEMGLQWWPRPRVRHNHTLYEGVREKSSPLEGCCVAVSFSISCNHWWRNWLLILLRIWRQFTLSFLWIKVSLSSQDFPFRHDLHLSNHHQWHHCDITMEINGINIWWCNHLPKQYRPLWTILNSDRVTVWRHVMSWTVLGPTVMGWCKLYLTVFVLGVWL